jgi:hypothetical protein
MALRAALALAGIGGAEMYYIYLRQILLQKICSALLYDYLLPDL